MLVRQRVPLAQERDATGSDEASFVDVLRTAVTVLDSVPFGILGGVAAYGRPRWTKDIDVFCSAEAIDRTGADLVFHGHAHRGSPSGVTPGGVRVRNVAEPVIGAPFCVFELA
jgi:hypothetical protein